MLSNSDRLNHAASAAYWDLTDDLYMNDRPTGPDYSALRTVWIAALEDAVERAIEDDRLERGLQ